MKPEYLLATLVAVAVGGIAVVTSLDRHFTATPPRCEGQSFDLVTAPGGRSPYIRLAVDGRTGPFLLDYGATTSSLPSFPTGQFNQANMPSMRRRPVASSALSAHRCASDLGRTACCGIARQASRADTTSVRAAEHPLRRNMRATAARRS
jgi:hypothetical protein